MAAITRDTVFDKLGEVSMVTLRAAYEFAKQRNDAYIEPVHWVLLWLRTDGCDVVSMLDGLGIARAGVIRELEDALGGLRRSSSSRLNFSGELELVIERGWI